MILRAIVTVVCANGAQWVTEANGTEVSIRDYFAIGKYFDVGQDIEEVMSPVTSVSIKWVTITRKEYMANSRNLHNDYFAQFVSDGTKSLVVSEFSVEVLKEAIAVDRHLNSLPLAKWDQLAKFICLPQPIGKNLGEVDTLSVRVCILKEAARQLTLD